VPSDPGEGGAEGREGQQPGDHEPPQGLSGPGELQRHTFVVGLPQVAEERQGLRPQVGAGRAKVLRADRQPLSVVGPSDLDLPGVRHELGVEGGQGGAVGGLVLRGLGDQCGCRGDRRRVRLALAGRLQTTDEERVRRDGVGLHDVGLDRLDPHDLVSVRGGPIDRAGRRAEGLRGAEPEHQGHDDPEHPEGTQPAGRAGEQARQRAAGRTGWCRRPGGWCGHGWRRGGAARRRGRSGGGSSGGGRGRWRGGHR
jgi:uncharacterized membrane protein YgcG